MHDQFPMNQQFQFHSNDGGWALAPCCCFPIVGVLIFAFWLWMFIDCLTRTFRGNEQVVWVLVIVLLGPLGALVYLIVGRGQGVKRPGDS